MEERSREGGLQEREDCRVPYKKIEQQWEDRWQEFLKTMQPGKAGETDPAMLEAAPWNDTRAFLASFEQVAKACQWPRGEWVARLLPALSGEADKAFGSLEAQDKEDYGKVKAAILRVDALRMEKQRQHFRHFSCQEVEDPRRIHCQLQELCHRWLRPERRSKEQILELLILEQFLASLPLELQGWIRARGPDTCSQAVALVEDFLMSQQQNEKGKWEGLLKEECLGFLEAEGKLSSPAEGPICKEAEQDSDLGSRVSGSGVKYPDEASPLPSLKGPEMVPTGMKEEPLDLKETISPAQSSWQGPPQPSQPTVIWKVLQEASGSMDFLGDGAGNQVKVENSQWEGDRPEGAACTVPQRTQGNMLEMGEKGYESEEEQGKPTLKTEDEFDERPGAVMAVDGHPSDADETGEILFTMRCSKDGEHCPLSVESFPQNPISNKHQRTIVGGDESGLPEQRNRGHLGRHQSLHVEETSRRTPELGKGFSCSPLQSNQGIQNEGWPYKCSFCRKCFSQQEHLMNHRQLHTGEKLHKCAECGKIFTSRQALRRHQEIHTLGKPYKCSQCGKSFSRGRNLTVHQRIHTGEKPYMCPECGKGFRWMQCLKNHQRIHNREKQHQCSQCGKWFSQRRYLKNHQRIHTGLKPYKCPQCGKCFSMVEYLKNHQRIHTGLKPYECPQCGKCFSTVECLKNHQSIHTGLKPYECPQCGKCFRMVEYLKNHQRIHTGLKPCECPQCGKCFSMVKYLKNHQRIHTGLKPYECPQCGKCFSMVKYLKNHQRIHTRVKPYQCSHCGKSYIQKVALMNHQRSHFREKSKDSLHAENASATENV